MLMTAIYDLLLSLITFFFFLLFSKQWIVRRVFFSKLKNNKLLFETIISCFSKCFYLYEAAAVRSCCRVCLLFGAVLW